MAREANTDGRSTVAADQPRAWNPSLPPAHRSVQAGEGPGRAIVEQRERGGISHSAVQILKRPIVKLVIGLSLFISAAIVVDSFVDMGWTEREPKLRASKHARPVPVQPVPEQ